MRSLIVCFGLSLSITAFTNPAFSRDTDPASAAARDLRAATRELSCDGGYTLVETRGRGFVCKKLRGYTHYRKGTCAKPNYVLIEQPSRHRGQHFGCGPVVAATGGNVSGQIRGGAMGATAGANDKVRLEPFVCPPPFEPSRKREIEKTCEARRTDYKPPELKR